MEINSHKPSSDAGAFPASQEEFRGMTVQVCRDCGTTFPWDADADRCPSCVAAMVGPEVYGYDGSAYGVGDRVELHPGTDLWMRGARFGVVVGIRPTPRDRVTVTLDKVPGRRFSGSADTFRRV